MSAAAESTMPATASVVVVERDQADLAPVIALHPMQRPEIGTEQTDLLARIAELEARVADLQDRNRELASDLDNALDQLSGHALHDEQERLVHAPTWSPWTASMSQEGHQR
ncbi:hypothetical protein BOX37_07250 [Nocardia mangyaensis]|uniref:Uncharacterized protein n=1 Tax=Nocardia mangyaensis TaxID=2213200 RepID=A0A1J0VP56_9NOCA|nr:hypothetical protein [Nocardia mangyaensis]APE33801.1 hypothetical protein BOX37_07250 [Nocardia mangyaensis]